MGIFTWVILSSVGYSDSDPLYLKYINLSDAFFVPGIIVFLFGVLVWISTTGFFDSISYIVAIGARALLPFMRRDSNEKYYEYKMAKEEKRIKGYSFILISGAIYLAVGVIFTALYYSVQP